MKIFVMKCAVLCIRIVYSIIKLCPVKDKVTFISRQSNSITLDFQLLKDELEKAAPELKIVVLTKKLEGDILSLIEYAIHMIIQMYHLATAKVILLDGYCITASVLNHKRDTSIIQMWHALGAVKRFGYQALDLDEGSSKAVATTMKMHNNYDYVFCASNTTARFFSEALNTPEEKFSIIGMPRVDYIMDPQNKNDEIYTKHPNYVGKKTILYIPTFRKNSSLKWEEFVNIVDTDKYNLIIKAHDLDSAKVDERYLASKEYNTYDLMKFADYIITDYSATAMEASILGKPLFFYLYDYDEYISARGLNIDPFKEMASATSSNIGDIIDLIEQDKYNYEELNGFKSKYIETLDFSNTKAIASKVIELL